MPQAPAKIKQTCVFYMYICSPCTMQSKWITWWRLSLDHIGLGNHLVLKWLVSWYNLIHENLLLIMQISNDLGSWLPCGISICHKGTGNVLFLIGSCLLPFKTRKTGQCQSDLASWRAVRESQVAMYSHSTAPIQRSLRRAQHLSGSQFKDMGLMCWEDLKGLCDRIMQKGLNYYINNCLLLNPKGRAIKALASTNRCLLHEHTFAFRVVSITVHPTSHPTIGFLPKPACNQNGSYGDICHWIISVWPTI